MRFKFNRFIHNKAIEYTKNALFLCNKIVLKVYLKFKKKEYRDLFILEAPWLLMFL